MTFQDSIRVCLRKYADFNGTASRPEYWWFFLFVMLGQAVASVLFFRAAPNLPTLFSLLTILPLLAAGSRRLHDTGRSGWWQLIGLVPVAGFFVLVFFFAQPGGAAAVDQRRAVSG